MDNCSILVDNVIVTFKVSGDNKLKKTEQVLAVHRVSLEVQKGECFGIIGESGSGKSTLAKAITGLILPNKGQISLFGKRLSHMKLTERSKLIQYVFQDPIGSLNPRMKIKKTLLTPVKSLHKISDWQALERVLSVLESLSLPENVLDKYPHEFSGGQAQRICIARALLARPKILVLDEPVSALDVSVQAQILQLLTKVQERNQLTFVFISHDISVVSSFCDRIAVMRSGKFVEVGKTSVTLRRPQHHYTKLLIDSIPKKFSPLI